MREVLDHYRPQIDASDVLDRLLVEPRGYFLVSAHREENVDSPDRLRQLLRCLEAVHARWNLPIHVSTHPRTKKRLAALPDLAPPQGLIFQEPLGFHDYNRLQLSAACVLSDSGTIAEEASILGFPAVTLRDSIERPEALDSGGIMMTGLDVDDALAAVTISMDRERADASLDDIPFEYLIRNTSDRAVRFILSTARRHRTWSGLRPRSSSR